jgi:hypothetical protein
MNAHYGTMTWTAFDPEAAAETAHRRTGILKASSQAA